MISTESFDVPPVPPTERVAAYLATIPWGKDRYPLSMLAISQDEQQLITDVQAQKDRRAVARNRDVTYRQIRTSYRVAMGKKHAQDGLDDDIQMLHPLAVRTVIFNKLFGKGWQNVHRRMIDSEPQTALEGVDTLNKRLGRAWKNSPPLCLIPSDTLNRRADLYDAAFGNDWHNYGTILSQNEAVVQQRIRLYDSKLTPEWRSHPGFVVNSTRTVLGSIAMLKIMGITQRNTTPGTYSMLLKTTPELKRQKLRHIQHEIIGATSSRPTGKVPLSELVAWHRSLTPEQLAAEAQSWQRVQEFVELMTPKRLAWSKEKITEWDKDANIH